MALTHMIELYLNPDQEGIWEEKEGVRILLRRPFQVQ